MPLPLDELRRLNMQIDREADMSQIQNPDLWQQAAMPRRLPPAILPGEFMKAPSRIVAKMGLPQEFGPYAQAADDVTVGIKDTIGSTGPAAEAALSALKRYVAKMF